MRRAVLRALFSHILRYVFALDISKHFHEIGLATRKYVGVAAISETKSWQPFFIADAQVFPLQPTAISVMPN